MPITFDSAKCARSGEVVRFTLFEKGEPVGTIECKLSGAQSLRDAANDVLGAYEAMTQWSTA